MWKYIVAFAVFATSMRAAEEHPTLALGAQAPEFSLPGIDGKIHSLRDYEDKKVMVVIFTCNHCPIAQMYEARTKQLNADYRDKSVGIVAIQPNDPNAIRVDELDSSDVSDSLAEMKIRAAYKHIDYTYLYDGATQSAANAYGPKATPHVFVFDSGRKLRYEGRFDDNYRLELVKSNDARNAIEALLADKPVPVGHTGVFGCSTKWKYKEKDRLNRLRKIEAEPVNLVEATPEDLKSLRSNGAGKLVLVSFWNTRSGESIGLLSEFETTYQMYSDRDFDFVSVSTNAAGDRAEVLKVLQEQHASTRNLLLTEDAQGSFNIKPKSILPHSVLISPEGKILFEKEGELDILQLRRTILANVPSEYAGFRKYWTVN